MKLGIFAKTFARSSLEENLDAVRDHGFACTQYNLVCAGLPTLPDTIDPALCRRIRDAHAQRGLVLAAVSGTFNIIDPDIARRETNLSRLRVLAGACEDLGTSIVTLCTGTRAPDNMWQRHPANDSSGAWREMVAVMRRIVGIAEETGVTVGIEPEVNNIVDSPQKARRLLDTLGSEQVKVIMDAANLFKAGTLSRMRDVLHEAFEHLGRDVVIAHAKDLSQDGDAGHEAAGTGMLDYAYYLERLRHYEFDGPLITHGLSEPQVPRCVAFLQEKITAAEG